MRTLALLLCLTAAAWATQFTAEAGGGNWSSDATWSGTGVPGLNDTVILDGTSGRVTVDVASACRLMNGGSHADTLDVGEALTCYGDWSNSATIKTYTGVAIVLAATGAANITTNGRFLRQVTFNGVGPWSLQGTTIITHPVFTAGTLNLNGQTFDSKSGEDHLTPSSGFRINVGTGTFEYSGLTIPSGCTLTVSTGTLYSTSDADVTATTGTGVMQFTGAGLLRTYGSFSFLSGFACGTSTVNRVYTASVASSSTSPLYNYTIGEYGTNNITSTLGRSMSVNNNFFLGLTGTVSHIVNADTCNIYVGGNWTQNDSFNPGTGSVYFIDSTKTTTVAGDAVFNVLACTTSGKVIDFTASTTQTAAKFDFNGEDGSLDSLNTNTGSGTFTLSDDAGTDTFNYCYIENCTATGGATFLALNSVDGGGNSGITFGGEPPAEPTNDAFNALFWGD